MTTDQELLATINSHIDRIVPEALREELKAAISGEFQEYYGDQRELAARRHRTHLVTYDGYPTPEH